MIFLLLLSTRAPPGCYNHHEDQSLLLRIKRSPMMKQIILYDSATGNTEYLAKALSHALPNVPCGPVGSLDCSKAELVYLGFWAD